MDIRITHIISLDAALMSVLMSGVSGAAIASSAKSAPAADKAAPAPQGTATVASEPTAEAAATAAVNDDVADGTLDAAGHPWSEALHASTKGTTKDGLWRMKVGVSRPAPVPGFPKDAPQTGGTGTPTAGEASPPTGTVANQDASSTDDDDEFAAFTAAAASSNAADAGATAVARKWTDADLGVLCNQAAVKLGDPSPVKALIAEFVGADGVAHSRNIPEAKREDFAKAVEAKAGIEFAG